MAGNNDRYRLGYGASNYNPDSGRGSVSFGGIGSPVRDFSSPGRSFGSGVGATVRMPMKFKAKAKGGTVKMAKGGSTASKRADGCATKGKTKGRFV